MIPKCFSRRPHETVLNYSPRTRCERRCPRVHRLCLPRPLLGLREPLLQIGPATLCGYVALQRRFQRRDLELQLLRLDLLRDGGHLGLVPRRCVRLPPGRLLQRRDLGLDGIIRLLTPPPCINVELLVHDDTHRGETEGY